VAQKGLTFKGAKMLAANVLKKNGRRHSGKEAQWSWGTTKFQRLMMQQPYHY
jgi:hypothetical protein